MPKANVAWDDRFYVKVYSYAKSGMPDHSIMRSLGAGGPCWRTWLRTKPALRHALEEGRRVKDEETFREYVFKSLSPEMKEVWDRINMCEDLPTRASRIEEMLAGRGQAFRQHLFVYALVDCNFNLSEACRKSNISKPTMDRWIALDPKFRQLLDEIHWHKGNFFETALIDAVKEGDAAAILFANKTFNRDRGYGESVNVQINKTTIVNKSVKNEITLNLAELSIDKRKRIVEILREGNDNPVKMLEVKNGQVHGVGGGSESDGESQ